MSSRMSRMKAKTRAIAHLQRIRDATLDIFRNIQQTSRLQHEDEWKERSELLAQNRERLLAILQITQNQLTASVTELKSHNAHKSRVDVLQRRVPRPLLPSRLPSFPLSGHGAPIHIEPHMHVVGKRLDLMGRKARVRWHFL